MNWILLQHSFMIFTILVLLICSITGLLVDKDRFTRYICVLFLLQALNGICIELKLLGIW